MMEPRNCAFDNIKFTPTKKHQIYCSEACRKAAYWSKHETIGPEYADALTWALAKLKKHGDEIYYLQLQTLLGRVRAQSHQAIKPPTSIGEKDSKQP